MVVTYCVGSSVIYCYRSPKMLPATAYDSKKLNLALLRLATEVRVDRQTQHTQGEHERLQWDLHRGQREHIEAMTRFRRVLSDAEKAQRTALLKGQLEGARSKLDSDQVNLEVVQMLVHQLDSRIEDFHIDVDELQAENVLRQLDGDAAAALGARLRTELSKGEDVLAQAEFFQCHSGRLNQRIEEMQTSLNRCSGTVVHNSTELIQDAIRAKKRKKKRAKKTK